MKLRRIRLHAAKVYHLLYFPPAVILVAVMLATIFTWRSARVSLAQDIQASIDAHIDGTQEAVRSSLTAYEEILRGGVGLFQGSDEVTREDWKNYLNAFDVEKNYRGVQSLGFIKVATAQELPALTAYMQAQGITDFRVQPSEPPRDTYALVAYTQAQAPKDSPPFGYDMYSEAVRRAAIVKARDTDSTTITSRIPLFASEVKPPPYGFKMFSPYFTPDLPTHTVEERRAAIRGYVFASFRASVFFKSVGASTDSRTSGYRIRVAGNSPQNTLDLYQSDHFEKVSKQPHAITVTRPLSLFAETWNIDYVFDRSGLVSEVQLRRPPSVLFGGSFIAVLIAAVVLLLLRARAHELAAQKEHAVELAKDELLSLASHQLRTPATGVKQYVGMVLQGFAGRVPKDQRELLEKAYASNDRQLQIINEILHLAKIDSGRIVLARQRTDLNELVNDIVNEQRPDIASANHHFTLQLPKRRIMLNVDAHMLRMAIENVLSNAIKYTPSGGRITVKLYHNRNHAFVQITDTGIGIAPGDQNELFKQFTRLPNAMSQQVGGTGIGLYLSKHLVELHGGWITIDSALGEGSTFTIILPLKSSEL